jgi:hypothetical protein
VLGATNWVDWLGQCSPRCCGLYLSNQAMQVNGTRFESLALCICVLLNCFTCTHVTLIMMWVLGSRDA